MGWKTVEVFTNEYISLYLNNLLIRRDGEKILISLPDIDTLILHNDRSNISIKLINALSQNNINTIFMNAKHEPSAFILPVNGHHNSLKIFQSQIDWTNQYKGTIWKDIIKNKIFNQIMLLDKMNIKYDKSFFGDLIQQVKVFDVTNREGHAAKVYWHTLFSPSFIRDQKAIKYPIINSMLNYGYAILRSLVIKSIIAKGLDTRISFFHKSFTNFFALASDIMEIFRPLIDEIVYAHREIKIFNIGIRDELIGIVEKKVIVNSKNFYLNKAIDKYVDGLVSGNGHTWVDLWE